MKRLVLLCAAFALLGYAALALSRSTTFMMFGDIVAEGPADAPRIALTFDDGPTPKHLPAVLEILAEHNVPATFFLVGQDVEAHPNLVADIAAGGHEIGNHSFSHPRMVLMTTSQIANEIDRTDAAIRTTGYEGPIQFRPPYGKKLVMLPLYLSRANRAAIMWSIAPDDDPDLLDWSDLYATHVISETRAGSIILMHVMFDGNATQRAALPVILKALHARGFEFVTISDLLASGG